jgi:hypothetical protein
MGNPTPSELKQLRKRFFDGSDQFMNGSAVFGKAGPHHDKRIANMHLTDPWAFDDEQMRLLFQRAFPNINTKRETKTQHKRALQWMNIIYRWFRRGQTASRVARAMGTNAKQVEDTIRRIRKAAAGLRTTGKPRTNTRGRPKKRPGQITPQVPPGQ